MREGITTWKARSRSPSTMSVRYEPQYHWSKEENLIHFPMSFLESFHPSISYFGHQAPRSHVCPPALIKQSINLTHCSRLKESLFRNLSPPMHASTTRPLQLGFSRRPLTPPSRFFWWPTNTPLPISGIFLFYFEIHPKLSMSYI